MTGKDWIGPAMVLGLVTLMFVVVLWRVEGVSSDVSDIRASIDRRFDSMESRIATLSSTVTAIQLQIGGIANKLEVSAVPELRAPTAGSDGRSGSGMVPTESPKRQPDLMPMPQKGGTDFAPSIQRQ